MFWMSPYCSILRPPTIGKSEYIDQLRQSDDAPKSYSKWASYEPKQNNLLTITKQAHTE